MKKNEKRTYLSPETEVVRFNVDDIITTSPNYVTPSDEDNEDYNDPENSVLLPNP